MKPGAIVILLVGLTSLANAIGQPAITSQPKSQSVSLGANVTFQVRATGIEPVIFIWRRNSVDIPEAVTNALVVTNIQSVHAGDYVAVVTDSSGSVTSRVATLQVDAAFTKITAGSIVNDRSASSACAWGDYDNDGWPDLFVNNFRAVNFLYRNRKDGTFEKITEGHMVTNILAHLAGVWGDYDNDGLLDLLGVNGGAVDGNLPNFLYHNKGDGTFTLETTETVGEIAADKSGFHGAAWGDYDQDGYLDVFVANFIGANYLYRNVGGVKFAKLLDSLNRPASLGRGYAEAAWADLDNDGDLDLLLVQNANANGKNLLFRNDDHGIFTPMTSGPIAGEGARSAGVGWGDYDNDGWFDLFVSNFPGQPDLFYQNMGNGTFDKISNAPPVNMSADTYGVAWGDYDNDGFLDLFVANGFIGAAPLGSFLFRNQGDRTFDPILTGSLVNDQAHSIACAWADYDNDGFLDLFVANDSLFESAPPESNFLYRNNGNSNAWLKVRCVGTVSNRAGIGAKVRVKARYAGQERSQLRQIASSDGRTDGSLEAHFGLGDATIIDTLRIEWPSGIVQELHDVQCRQSLTMREPARLSVTGPETFRIHSWKGMAFEVQTSSDLEQWSTLTTITNLTGSLDFTDLEPANGSRRFYRTALR